MKRIFTLVLFFVVIASTSKAQSGNTYVGNGATGFNGGVGNSFLTITDNSTTINFTLSTSGNDNKGLDNNVFVLYLDTKTGGIGNTSSLSDRADNGRRAISGTKDASTRTTATFAPGFSADYAISVEQGNFAGIFDLSTPSNLTYIGSANLTTTTNSSNTGYVLTFSVPRSSIGLTNSFNFSFVASFISTTAYRSNETIGGSTTLPDPANSGTAPNAGFTGTTVFTTSNNYGFTILPLKLISFSGKTSNNSTILSWVTDNERGVQSFVIEGSSNSTNWQELATITAKNTLTAQYTQTLTSASDNFYRLKIIDRDGKITYSPIINLKNTAYSIKLITNPVVGSIRLSINADVAKYTATIYSVDGKAVATAAYNHPGGVSTFEMPLSGMAKGNYLLRVANATEVKAFSIMVQ